MYLLKSKAATLAVHPIFLVYKAVKDDEYLMMDSVKKTASNQPSQTWIHDLMKMYYKFDKTLLKGDGRY